jgi:hypothetical protein
MKKKTGKNEGFGYIVVDENYDSFQICDSLDEVSDHIEDTVEDSDGDYQDYLRVFEIAREISFKYIKKVVYEE